jgi:hypothetical protein
MRPPRMKEPSKARRGENVSPNREFWWWREDRLERALDENRQLDHFCYWKAKGRKSPDGKEWTLAQRLAIETAVWLYELDARITRKFLFGKPAHLLTPEQLSSVVAFARTMRVPSPIGKKLGKRRPFMWEWIEYFDKRNDKNASKLSSREVNGIIAAMKFCLEYFLHG